MGKCWQEVADARRDEMTAFECAKAIAKHINAKGGYGGWIKTSDGKVLGQGWFDLANKWTKRGWIVDRGEPFGCHINWRKVQ